MKKIFTSVYKISAIIGFILFLFIISLTLASFSYFDHQLNTVDNKKDLEIYLEEEVSVFSSYGNKEISIEIEFKEVKNESFLIAYSVYYYDKYQLPIHMYVVKQNIIIIINSDSQIAISYY